MKIFKEIGLFLVTVISSTVAYALIQIFLFKAPFKVSVICGLVMGVGFYIMLKFYKPKPSSKKN